MLEARGLARVAGSVAAAAKPSVLLISTQESEETCSRLGGRPNLPEQLDWPEWRGLPLPFIAQLDLAEILSGEDLGLPPSGSLYFFYEGGETWGFDPKDKGSAQVIYSTDAPSRHALRELPEDVPEEMRFVGVRLEAGAADASLPDGQDQVIESLKLSAEERNAYDEFLEELGEARPDMYHRLGGYPEPVQGDPRLEAQLVSHGLYCGRPSGYQRGKELGLWPGATDWTLLLQVDSDEAAGMMWGDAGRLYFLIRREDLAARAFEKAWLILQCG